MCGGRRWREKEEGGGRVGEEGKEERESEDKGGILFIFVCFVLFCWCYFYRGEILLFRLALFCLC